MKKEKSLLLVTRGTEIECRNPVYRGAIHTPALITKRRKVAPSSIVADFPRRWKNPRKCKVRTTAGDFPVTATPHPDHSILLDGENIDEIASAIGLSR